MLHVGLPFAPERTKVGYEVYSQYQSDKALALSILRGQSALIQVATEYSESYNGSNAKLVLHYRDYLVSEAIKVLLQQTQLKSDNTLTHHAEKVWSNFSYGAMWPYRSPEDPVPEPRYWGPFGSLAHLSQYCDPSTPLTLMESILRFYWSLLGIDPSGTPSHKLSRLLTYVIPDINVFKAIDQHVVDLYGSLDLSPAGVMIARQGLTIEDFQNLKQRLLCGEYNDSILLILSETLPAALWRLLKPIIHNTLGISKPGGFLMVAQAFVLEGYVRAIRILTDLPRETQTLTLTTWKQNPNLSIAFELSRCFALASDGRAIQAYWDSIDGSDLDAKRLAKVSLDWLSLSGLEVQDTEFRLGGIFET